MFHVLTRRPRILAGVMSLALLAVSCGGVGTSRETARDQATSVSCDWYNGCKMFGTAGAMYTSADSCQIDVRAKWESAWPVADCEGKIDSSALNLCLNAIAGTICGNALDILNTLANKCSKAKVCGASADGGA
jgi:Family of unknown function (DUF6184)